MTRKKVKLAFIANDSARKATYKKRKKGLLKKVNELSTLCGIDACAIIYSPYDSQPEVWPNPLGVQRVLAHFKRMPEMEQSKKMVNQESFLRQRITKAKDQFRKMQKDNREKEITHVMYQSLVGKGFNHLNLVDLNDLGWLIDQTLKDINNRIDVLKKGVFSSFASAPSTIHNNNNNNGGPRTGGGGLLLNNNAHCEEKPPPVVGAMFDSIPESSTQKQWFMDLMMNSNDQMGGQQLGAADEIMPLGDMNNTNTTTTTTTINNNGNNNNNGAGLWSNAFFPWEK